MSVESQVPTSGSQAGSSLPPRQRLGRELPIILLVAFNLRAALVALSPVLDEVRHDTGLSSSGAGLLLTLPVLCFAGFSPAATRLARRWGLDRVLLYAMVLLVAGILARLVHPVIALFAGTVVLGAAIAAANVLLPALVKRDHAARIGLMTGSYVTALSVGATAAAGLTVPLQHALGLGWRGAVTVWALPAVVAVLVLWSRHAKTPDAVADAAPPVRGLYRDSLAWQVTGFMGLQSLIYYASVAWLPTLFVAEGLSPARAGFLLGIMNLVGVPVSLAVTLRAGARRTQTDLVVGSTALTAAGLIAVVVAPLSAPVLWMVVLGIGQGATISLALTLIGLRSPDARHTAQLSSMAQSIGYLIAAVGPVSLGIVHTLTGNWRTAFLITLAALALQCACGLGAARHRQVGARRA